MIAFNIAGAGVHTINLASALPTITGAVTIDGYTQTGSSVNTLSVGNDAVLTIELNGTGAGSANGLTLGGGSTGSTIRGLVINRFSLSGIQLDSANNLIAGNWIGVDSTGTVDLGNTVDGITISANTNTIGTSAAADRNILSGNNDEGVDVGPGINATVIRGNYIGTSATGTAVIGNGDALAGNDGGVRLDGNNTILGGTVAGEGNLVRGNWGPGVIVNGTGNTVLGNSIYENETLGIDLAEDGLTTNDAGDGDTGANNLQNFPVLTSAQVVSSTQVTIIGSFNSTASSHFRIEFFSSAAQDATGHGEGQTYLGFVNVTTDMSGNVSFNTTLTANLAGDSFVSATATQGNATFTNYAGTSEFAQNVVVANTAPALDASKSPVLTAINEDAGAPSGVVGTLVSQLVDFASPAGQVDNVTDADAGALLGIAITTVDTTNGTWFYSTNNGTSWNALGAVSDASARLLAADANTRLYFQPNANYNGTLANAITFRAWDRTSGSNGSLADTSTSGGTTAFSSATDTASLVVTAVNDAPVNTVPGAQTVNEDTALAIGGVSVTDVDGNLSTVQLGVANGTVTVSLAGGATISSGANGTATLTLSGSQVDINATLASLIYQGTLNYNGPDTLTVTSRDSNAVTDVDTVAITVNPVNDAPGLAANAGSTVAQGGTDSITTAELQVIDVDNTPAQLTYTVTVGPVNGQLELTTAPGVAINSFTQAQIDSGLVVYVHNGSFTASDSFTFTVSDGAGGNIGATNFGITVTSVNSVPSLATNAGSTVVQGLTDLITSGELQVTDADNTPAQLIYTVTVGPVNGQLELTTAPGVAITSFTQADIDAGRLVFVHSGAISTSDSFTFTVSDGAGGTIGATTFNLTVTPFVPAAPASASSAPGPSSRPHPCAGPSWTDPPAGVVPPVLPPIPPGTGYGGWRNRGSSAASGNAEPNVSPGWSSRISYSRSRRSLSWSRSRIRLRRYWPWVTNSLSI